MHMEWLRQCAAVASVPPAINPALLWPARAPVLACTTTPAGWQLLQAMLRPRRVLRDRSGRVTWAYDSKAVRISARAALRHRFLRRAADPAAQLRSMAAAAAVSGTASSPMTSGEGAWCYWDTVVGDCAVIACR